MTIGGTTLTSAGSFDGFVAKFNAAGSFQWVVRTGSTGTENACGMGIDAAGNPVVSLYFSNTVAFVFFTSDGCFYKLVLLMFLQLTHFFLQIPFPPLIYKSNNEKTHYQQQYSNQSGSKY